MSRLMALRKVGLVLVAALLSACGGGGGTGTSTSPSAPVALTFVASAPTPSGATGVALTAVVTATASQPLNPLTLNGTTFVLTEVGGGTVTGTVAVTGNTVTLTPDFPLAGNTQYMATITTGAASTTGNVPASNFSWTFVTVTVPGAPTSVSAIGGNAQATVTFMPPASDGGAAILSYTVTSSPGGVTATGAAGPGPLSVVVPGLINGTPYTFSVTATNNVGTGPPSSASNSATPDPTAVIPGAPTAVSALPGDSQATVSFAAPAFTGGAGVPILNYVVTSSPGGISTSGGASPIVVPGLTNGTAYTFTVTAFNPVGPGPASAPSLPVTPAGVPGAPIAPVATAGNAQATVAFTPPVSNGGSAITNYTVTSNPGGITASGAASPILVTGLTNGTPYTFSVTATNSVGTGAPSAASNSATPSPVVTVPGAPTGAAATAGDASATVSFTAPASNGGAAITSYTVTSSPGGVTASGGVSPILVSGLANGTTYTFTVRATNSVGSGPASAATGPVTPATVPGAPTGASATAGNGQATVSFAAPVSNGGSAISVYAVTSNPGGITAVGGASPIAVTGLSNGIAYTFTVTATNAVGTGVPSAPTGSVTPTAGTVPGAPTSATAVAGNAQATVSFVAPASNGGSAITAYTVTSSPGGIVATGAGSPIVVTGLTNGTAYTFSVTATNSVGEGPASGPSNSVSPATIPGAPTGVSATAGNTQATVSFSPPASNGGAAITNYLVTSTPGGITAFGAASPILVTGLTNTISYTFRVTAFNSVGPGPQSAASNSVTPNPAVTVPGAPTGVTATGGNAQATVNFTAPASDGGSLITGYTVTSSPGGITASGAGPSILVPGLTNGTAYTFTVVANNAIGPSPPSGASNAVTPATVPGAPTSANATAGNAQATVTFTAPASNGGAAITGYTVTARLFVPGCLPVSCASSGITATGGSSPIVVPGLTNGTQYVFTISATNSAGTGAESAASNIAQPNPVATVPGSPTGVTAVAGNTQATVSWTPPASDGGSPISGYTITSNPPGGVDSCVACSSTSRAVTGLTNGVAYTFTVVAINLVGSSPPSGASNSVTPATVPGAPSPVTAAAGNSQATVTFTAPSNGGSAILNYLVTSTPDGLTAVGAASPIVVTGLTNGTSYTFTVTATNAIGSTVSAASNAVVPTAATVPTAPTAASATAGNGQATVSFTAPAGFTAPGCALPVCAPVTGYTVTSSPSGITASGATSPIVVTGLSNGTAYTFTVIATNAIGTSPASAASNSVTPVTTPGAPTAVSASAGNGQATVSFTPPASNGGSAITGYRVFCQSGAPCPVSVDGASSPIVVTGLTNGNAYTFTVSAINAVGVGTLSAASNSVTPANAPPACSPTVPVVAGPISLRAEASRSSGVSPLSVFFDASATTSSATTRPFHDLEFRWTFGDPTSGTWSRGTRPGVNLKNEAMGPVASHLYEPAPGSGTQSYTAVVTATDGTNTATCSIPISVTDPDVVFTGGATVCIRASALPVQGVDGCPAGAAVLQNADFDAAVATAIAAGRRRILFRKDETFFANPGALIAVPGPGIIGSYGLTGTKAIVSAAVNNIQLFRLSSSGTPTGVTDWRFMDLDLDGLGGAPGAANLNAGFVSNGSYSNFSFVRLDLHDMKFGYLASGSTLGALNTPVLVHQPWDGVAFYDSTIRRILGGAGNGGNAVFMVNRRFGFHGSLIDDTLQAEHGLRAQGLFGGAITNNTFSNTARTTITIRGVAFGGSTSFPAGTFADKHVVSDNLMLGSAASNTTASTGPQAPAFDERIRDAIWERNWWIGGSATQQSFLVQGSDITIRNNLFSLIGSGSAISISDGGAAPVPDRVHILNNTFVRTAGNNFSFDAMVIIDPATNLRVHNNLSTAPLGGIVSMITNIGGATFAQPPSNNSSNAQITGATPLVTFPPTTVNHFFVNPGYAVGGGNVAPTALPVLSDFFRTPRPIGTIDIGATEQ